MRIYHPCAAAAQSLFVLNHVVPTMLLLQLPAVVLTCHLLDFLPAGAAWALIAIAHFTEIDAHTITSYVNARGSQLLRLLEAILRDGLTVPVFEYRQLPTVLLSCPCGSHRPARERLADFAFFVLGLPQQPETSFDASLMKFDTFMDKELRFSYYCCARNACPMSVCSWRFHEWFLFLLPPFFFKCHLPFQAQEDKDAWLPIYNYDLGHSKAYDDAILWLHKQVRAVLWIEHVQAVPLPSTVSLLHDSSESPVPVGAAVSYFCLLGEFCNISFVLLFSEGEDEHGRALRPQPSVPPRTGCNLGP